MTETLHKNGIGLTNKLINSGLAMARKSMEQILQCDISIKKVEFGMSILENKWAEGESLHTITTDLKGEIKGTNLLIFTEDEVNQIFKACLPPSITEVASEANEQMKMGFLSEVDNMVAAAVITEFANFLQVDMYGDVPAFAKMEANDLTQHITSQVQGLGSMLHFKAAFHSTRLNISPDFVWIFEDAILSNLRKTA